MARIIVPPIKTQGIKTKLVPWIQEHVQLEEGGTWIEPFMGSGVVGFNIKPKKAIFSDSNPHIIKFYQEINVGKITAGIVRNFLKEEGEKLKEKGKEFYYEVRERFNEKHEPLDFLFLNRSCFNGMIRFNRSGGFNVPFGHKPERFSKAYVTKIVNQVKDVEELCSLNEWEFCCQDFEKTFNSATKNDFIYCDPPYEGRHTDYFNAWNEEKDRKLFELLSGTKAKFILSTWHSNEHRENKRIEEYWHNFHIITRDHFYHLGAKEKNRKPMLEALVMNMQPVERKRPAYKVAHHTQPQLFEKSTEYKTE
ncbi:MAG: Dam family site-specific DNA-(adenine-N6)-methyltransferase [Anaerolineales bacterium]|uniref:Site-specific DNA-methyltransferase (adenine-specific) n=1 Tax=Candidatus Desulfolinea nitratireducens TaxID=2841698 RepID=A0A8J6NMS7_9CHLR|nr:Dam family site-specific DNA-(adenine-N6)-methyltransferase [Candidatus Desulfolinea nitratireducens]MBL6959530.1 Dam family site-specific DNA-(adenine-N6)-methyltransferase [Anaerolineales bacterium]